MGNVIKSNQLALDALGDDHGDVDLRLVERIDEVLVPLIGPSGIDEESWFQSMDFYGDGIRHLEFRPSKFPLNAIPALQALLVSEHEPFGILCWAPRAEDGQPGDHEGLVIFSGKLLLTSGLASESAHA
ncbi:hypothetical protein N800_13490 [Lysobacter daejeonensis GH1-9]|uniref:Uncharacterized protein n=2 Tax=Aerolutibacter TaxID=3382701 RepID=A0A0A0EQZ0_9GAMM|nr:hypothetical protein N800_13490 [Lysobacter daejeonensis GH1-9]